MTRQLNGNGRHTTTAVLENGSLRLSGIVTAEHSLVTSAWTDDVLTVEAAIRRFTARRNLASDCQVMLFEMAGDPDLHVNVIHGLPKPHVSGWAGPGRVESGVVYNRRFGNVPTNRIIQHIREMVFA